MTDELWSLLTTDSSKEHGLLASYKFEIYVNRHGQVCLVAGIPSPETLDEADFGRALLSHN